VAASFSALGPRTNSRSPRFTVSPTPSAPSPATTHWDVGTLWHEAHDWPAQSRRRPPSGAKLASVGVDVWGVDFALVNDAGRLVFPIHAYRDARTQPGLKRLAHTRAALERIYAATGIPNVFYNSSLQLEETVASCPALTDLATRCLFLPDYFNFLLSGRMENEFTIAQHDPAHRRPLDRVVARRAETLPAPAPVVLQRRSSPARDSAK